MERVSQPVEMHRDMKQVLGRRREGSAAWGCGRESGRPASPDGRWQPVLNHVSSFFLENSQGQGRWDSALGTGGT